jgi:hypothetical protein
MSWSDALQILFWIAVSLIAGFWIVFGYWRLRSELKRRREGDAPLQSSRAAIWRDPGDVSKRNLAAGPGQPPQPPFQFMEEHDTGSQPCVSIRDATGREWRVKWGSEVRTETFSTRLAWALGYFAEQTHFIAEGEIHGARDLRRAKECIGEDCRFVEARFELSERDVVMHFDAHSWAWNDNPFVGTRELNGLKILMMLLSNWDNKDVRDVARGSNTAIFEFPFDSIATSSRSRSRSGPSASVREARYLIIDWGAALGAWGSNIVQRGRWDAKAYAEQSAVFVTGVDGEMVKWGYQGQRTADLTENITRDDVRWFYRYAGQLTDEQLRDAFIASGATPDEAGYFTAAMRLRLEKLREVAEGAATAPADSRASLSRGDR